MEVTWHMLSIKTLRSSNTGGSNPASGLLARNSGLQLLNSGRIKKDNPNSFFSFLFKISRFFKKNLASHKVGHQNQKTGIPSLSPPRKKLFLYNSLVSYPPSPTDIRIMKNQGGNGNPSKAFHSLISSLNQLQFRNTGGFNNNN